MFLVGAYSDIVELAFIINDEFQNFTKNSEITLSAGIGIFNPSTPIWFIAEQVETLLCDAKSHGKNRLAIFNSVTKWADYKKAEDTFNNVTLPKNKDGDTERDNASIYYKLLEFADMSIAEKLAADEFANAAKNGASGDKYIDISNLMWRPRLRYLAARNNIKEDDVIKIATMIEEEPQLFKTLIFLKIYKNRGGRYES